MSKHVDPAVEEGTSTTFENTGSVDAEFDDLLEEAERLQTIEGDPRCGRWPANDYY